MVYEGSLCVRILIGAALGGGNPWIPELQQELAKQKFGPQLNPLAAIAGNRAHLIRIYRRSADLSQHPF